MFVAHVNGHCVENLCKHQVAILLTCTNFIKENIIQYYGTWYGSNHGGFVANLWMLPILHIYDNESDDEKVDEDHYEEHEVVDMCRLMTLDDTSPNVGKKKRSQPTFEFIYPTKKMFVRMGDIMQEIINEVKKGGVQFINHTTSLLRVIAIDVRNICLSKVNELMHFNMVFHCVTDGFGNSLHQIKDSHETILEHGNILNKRVRE
jgi:hypothetical protein